MPALEQTGLIHDVVLWPRSGQAADGDWAVGSPVDIKARWNQGRRQGTDPEGNTVALDGDLVLDQAVMVGSLVWLGTLADWNSTGSVGDTTEVMKIISVDVTSDIKGRATRYEAGFARHRDSPPSG